ncbi:MAG: O-antigen ligase family protein, partial [Candidatus Sumerlaeaceae bacterium]|nr:O-antigen ligase family protein [Candidatus Sumerlaeaceae bacterium]
MMNFPESAERNTNQYTRVIGALAALALILWAGSCYKQSLPYPFYGALWAAVLALLAFVTAWLILIQPLYNKANFFALCCAFGFAVWMVLRWVAEGAPTVGIENVITVVTWCAWLFVSAHLLRLRLCGAIASASSPLPRHSSLLSPIFASVAAVASLFALHAILQYTVIYDYQLQQLRASIGARTPTPLEMGLIHHLEIKRVASVWGDPNAFGCFCVFGVGASYYLWRGARRTKAGWALRASSVAASLLCMTGIILSGSRGALLDVLVLAGVLAGFYMRRSLFLGVLILPVIFGVHGGHAVETASPHEKQTPPTWWARSDTIRERVYYAQVGWAIFRQAPLTGAGPGCVEMLYARLKPAQA